MDGRTRVREGVFFERIDALKNDPERKRLKKSEEQYRGEIEDQRRATITEHGIGESALHIALMIERIILMKAYRVDVSWYCYWVLDPMFRKIARDHQLSLTQTWFLKPDEIIELLSGGTIDVDQLNWRSTMYALEFHDGKFCEYYGEAAQNAYGYLEQTTAHSGEAVSELIGDMGSPGSAAGIVKIVNTADDMRKMEKGNILVSHITNPRLVPAMKLAAAIVADIGGVTSHAAIVSRELQIPCVIGTKIATQVLKDGDRVEVDADSAIVRYTSPVAQ